MQSPPDFEIREWDEHGNMLRRRALINFWAVPKSRKPKFDLTLKIIDLNNVPLIVGTSHVKWHLPSSTSAEHRGRTDKVAVRDHKAVYDYTKHLPVRLTVDKAQNLEECLVHFEIVQDYSESSRGGRVVLGNFKVNLSEYVDRSDELKRNPDAAAEDDGEVGGITRRYLMHESKINSTLKVGITMRQTEGETNFVVPPLKTATVFGGIGSIVAAETSEGANGTGDGGETNMPNVTSKTREQSELQDIYRRTLAATWACQAGELPPDKLVEDLFHGGDGGAMKPPQFTVRRGWTTKKERDGEDAGSMDDSESRKTVRPAFLSPNDASGRDGNSKGGYQEQKGHRRHGTRGGSDGASLSSGGSGDTAVSGRGSIEQHMRESMKGDSRRRHQKEYREVTEFDIRDDLRSWTVTDKASLGGNIPSKHGSANINEERNALLGT